MITNIAIIMISIFASNFTYCLVWAAGITKPLFLYDDSEVENKWHEKENTRRNLEFWFLVWFIYVAVGLANWGKW